MSQHREGFAALKAVIIARYFTAQGMRYMNKIELMHRLAIELLLVLLSGGLLWAVAHSIWWVLLALPAAHFAMVFLNGHLFSLLKHDLFWFGLYKDMESFGRYVDGLQRRCYAIRNPGIARMEVYGSLTRGKFNEASDLDVRFISKPGFGNAWKSCGTLWKERLIALFRGFPIDAYMFLSQAETERKMKTKEESVIILFDASDQNPRLGLREQISKNQK